MALSEELGVFIAGFRLADDPAYADLLETARLHLLDSIGVALAATTMEHGAARALRAVTRAYGSSEESTLIGLNARTSAPVAALVNGSLIHGCEFDAMHSHRIIHPDGPSVGSALAVAERERASGRCFAEAWVVAAEATLRLAAGLNDDESLFSDGFHTTSIFGTFGAAAATAKLLALDAERTATALSLCVSFAAGTSAGWDAAAGGNKPLQPGWAAHAGVQSALLAAAGHSCALDTLDGPRGLYAAHAWHRGWDVERVLSGLGQRWEASGTAFKVYPAGGMIQAADDCTLELVHRHSIKPREVREVHVSVPAQFGRVLAQVLPESYRPKSGYAMFVSWPCNVARAIISHEVTVAHLTRLSVTDPELLKLADRVSCSVSLDETTTVSIVTDRGTFECQRVLHSGHPPEMTRERLVRKFRRNARLVLSEASVNQLVDQILQLEHLDSIGAITDLL